MKDLTKGKPIRLILLFAVPLFVGQLFQLFYSLADTRIVGQTLGDEALAAVGATTTLSDMLLSFLNGLTNGFAIVIATCFGAKDERQMKKAMGGTILLGSCCAVVLSGLCLLNMSGLLKLLNISPELFAAARGYIGIVIAGLLAATLYNICAAMLRAIGDSFTPLLFLILAAFLNIAMDYGFILCLHTGVEGAAYATVIAQAVSAFLCFLYMRRKYPQLTLKKEDFKPDMILYKKLFGAGLSMGFMTSLVGIGTMALQTSINTFGTDIIVAHTAARKISSIYMLPFSVMGTTLATYCGQNLGAGKYSRIRQGIRDTVLVTFVWCTGVIISAYTVAPWLIRTVTATQKKDIIDTASLYLRVNTPFYYVPTVICLFRNSMQGFGDNRTPVISSSLEMIGKVLIALLLAPAIGYYGIIVAEPIVWFIMVIPLVVNMVRSPVLKMKDRESTSA
ncbi:MATE family efflux transporter [Suilimivivens aceti]|jgi:MATE efflux family protein dinF|uniref:Probable multidrug resistance protein NorM n=1 Tax=Suilimivivens aceti TaxID=2981774 RepID=A0ABT2T2L6_9FIRM|nr:MATE family efflux transporter [Suilimivivens aceti]MCU6744131.1 MATE family efflux transporter [Suilimivivens aceti]SCH55796.1 Multidrug export protein mepA [uncultured Clostridium sp.]